MLFISCEKLFSFLRYFHICPEVLLMQKAALKKLKLIAKLMASQNGQQIIAILILPNISRNKDNQAVKLGQIT